MLMPALPAQHRRARDQAAFHEDLKAAADRVVVLARGGRQFLGRHAVCERLQNLGLGAGNMRNGGGSSGAGASRGRRFFHEHQSNKSTE